MTYSFNLIDQDWIPCVKPDGEMAEFSLRQALLQAHEIRGVQGNNPLETAALYRLLLAVLHSALRGPRKQIEWASLWQKGRWEADLVNSYLDRWRERFDLFHPARPFYQVGDERVKPKSVISLAMEMSAGNMATLFDHHTEAAGEALPAAKAARIILVAQVFGLAGLSGLDQKFTDAPWGRGIIFLAESDALFKTLVLNTFRYPDEEIMPWSQADQPAWEMDDPHRPERRIPKGYLDYLTWQNRRILLLPEGDETHPVVHMMSVAPGLRLDATVRDPMKLYRAGKKEGFIITRFQEDRALWRDSAALFCSRSQSSIRPPKTLNWIATLAANVDIPRQQAYRLMGLGMANNQAKVEFLREEHLPLPLEYLERDELVEQLATALDLAEKFQFSLRQASQWLALLVISPRSDGKKWPEIDQISKDQANKLAVHWNVERFYWQQLEIPFLHFLEDLPTHPEAPEIWRGTLRKAAWNALEQAANFVGDDATALKAAVRARGRLGYSLNNLFPEPEKEVSA